MVIENGLQAALYAILPHVLVANGVSTSAIWRVASGLLAVITAGLFVLNWRRAVLARISTTPVDLIFLVSGLAVVAMLAFNAVAIGFAGTSGPYILAVVWMLVVTTYPFLTILSGRKG